MGNSGSSLKPVLVQRQNLQCDGNGVAKFKQHTVSGQPAVPGFYKFICNVNINEAEVRGVMVNGQITPRGFVAVSYVCICRKLSLASLFPSVSLSLPVFLCVSPVWPPFVNLCLPV